MSVSQGRVTAKLQHKKAPQNKQDFLPGGSGGDLLGQAQVYQLHITLGVHHHILWLEIAVGNLVPVQFAQCQHHRGTVKATFLFGQFARGLQEVEELTSG